MRTSVRMGNAGHAPHIDLDTALGKADLPSAWFAAVESRYLYLDQALSLTLLLGREMAPSYNAAARKFLIRFIREVNPTLEQVKKVADALRAIGDPEDAFGEIDALPAMADLARQMRERRP